MMGNFSTDFLQTCRGSTNLVIHTRLTIIIDNRWAWLECIFLTMLAIIFNYGMPTHILANGTLWLEMLLNF